MDCIRLRNFKPRIQHLLGGGQKPFDYQATIMNFKVTGVKKVTSKVTGQFLDIFSKSFCPKLPINFILGTHHILGEK